MNADSVFATRRRRAISDRITFVVLAALAYLPLLRTQPEQVGADTKHYLYLDPGQLMSRASSVWDPSIGLGTVTHQNVGYLWPMGPWYAFWETVGVADWVAQRLWLATLFFAAGAGVMVLLRLLGLRGLGASVAALSYMLTPYVLAYAARISAILLPWAGLPWLLAVLVLALRRGGWRWPAVFALLVTTIGSINASSLVFAGLAVVIWVPFAVWHLRETSLGDALRCLGRLGLLSAVTQVWWIVALLLSGAHGPPVLETTETYEAVSTSSLSTEVLRSLGNWFFYGEDGVGPWVQAAVPYQQKGWLMLVSFTLPVVALVTPALVRWKHRAYFTTLVVVAAVIAVAAFPYDDPSPFGALTKDLAGSSTAALALRNAQRVIPLLALGVAALLGSLVHAIGDRLPWGRVLAAAPLILLIVANLPALWDGTLVDENLRRPEELPAHLTEAADHLDAVDDDTRVLELPGTDFGAYRWGNTVDPVLPGLLDRPWVGRESAPQGTAGSINIVQALDRRLQEGIFEEASLAPLARLLAAGDVVIRADLETERYRTPRPQVLEQLFGEPPPGLGEPMRFGAPIPNRPDPDLPLLDALELGIPVDTPHPAPITTFPVLDVEPIVHADTLDSTVVLSGDGDGIVDAAAAELLDGTESLTYTADTSSFSSRLLARFLDDQTRVVLTDTARRRAERFSTLRENSGATETADEVPLEPDAADARIDVFPDVPGDGDPHRTVTELDGVESIRASSYGNVVSYIPEERPALAFDDDLDTAWRTGAFDSPVGERLRVDFEGAETFDRVTLVQPLTGHRNRHVTEVEIELDDGTVHHVELTEASRTRDGQVIDLGEVTSSFLEVRIVADSVGEQATYPGLSAVGFAEIRVPGVTVDSTVRLPTDLAEVAEGHTGPLSVVLTRLRSNPAEPVRSDPERAIDRRFVLPSGGDRMFRVTGTARISTAAPDDVIDRVLGRPGLDDGGIRVTSSDRLPGLLDARASSALDGRADTAWQTPLGEQVGQAMRIEVPEPTTVDHLELQLLTDGRHSVPTHLRLESDDGTVRELVVPEVTNVLRPGATSTVPLDFEPVTFEALQVTITGVAAQTTTDYYSRSEVDLPVGISELGLPRVAVPALPDDLPGTCRDDLVTIDGDALPVRVVGSTSAASARDGLVLERCGGNAPELGAGSHTVLTVAGTASGLDVDRLVLDRVVPDAEEPGPDGGDGTDTDAAEPGPERRQPGEPVVQFERSGRAGLDVSVRRATRPFLLVLGESYSDAWEARVDGYGTLGEPVRVDGYATAWLVEPAQVDDGDGSFTVDLRWTPQRWASRAQQLSLAGAVVCLLLLIVGRRSERDRAEPDTPPALAPVPVLEPAWDHPGRIIELVPTIAAALLAGLGTSFFITPAVGPVFACIVIVTGLLPRFRALLPLGAAAILAVAGLVTVGVQMWKQYPPGFTWAAHFEALHLPGLVAVGLLATHAMLAVVAARSAPPRQARPDPREAG